MKLINTSIPILNTYDPNRPFITYTKGTSAVPFLRDFDINLWYCMFSCQNSFRVYSIKDLISEEMVNDAKAGKLYLALDNAFEPFLESIDSIYQNLVIRDGIPESQIMFMSNMYDALEYVNTYSAKINRKPIKVIWYNIFEWDIRNVVRHVYNSLPIRNLDYPRPEGSKKYLNLNRRWRGHRPLLTTILHQRDLLKDGLVSLGPCETNDNWNYRWRELTQYFRNDPAMLEILEKGKSVKDLPPMYLDTNELEINRAVLTQDTDYLYQQTYFSVISETTFFTRDWYHNVRFLSEKTFKAIGLRHPFILVTVPNSLEILRKQGYKTFDGIIDESYDLELDDGKRILKIADEIERLCNLSDAELQTFLLKAKEIGMHNFKVMLSKKTPLIEMN